MILNSATELIDLEHESSGGGDNNYLPTFINTSRRGASTSLGFWQIGSNEQHGLTHSPVFKMLFADLSGLPGGATHIKVWAVDNTTDDAPEFPVTFLEDNPELEVYLNKFDFTDGAGSLQTVAITDYTIVGAKKRQYPIVM